MTEYRTETTDRPTTTIVEKSGGGGMALIALVALALIAAIAYFVVTQDRRDAARDGAVTEAAQSVDSAATKIGDAAQRAVDKAP